MFRVGIVGCGGIAQVHAAVLHALPQTQLTAFADILPEKARLMAAQYGGHAYASVQEMLGGEELDAVHLCTPHFLHAPMAALAAEHGAAVFTEKPPAINRAQWVQLEQAARLMPLGVCFQNRYNANVQAVRQLLREKTHGKLLGARAFVTWQRDAAYYRDSGWRGRWETEGGGVLINQAVHTLDLLAWFMGAPGMVQCHMSNYHLPDVIEVEDTAEAYLTLGGKPALLYASTAYTQNAPVFIELQLEKATLRLYENCLDIVTAEGTEHRVFGTPEAMGKGYWGSGHLSCISDFYDSLTAGRPYQNDLNSVRNTVDALLRLYAQGREQLEKGEK